MSDELTTPPSSPKDNQTNQDEEVPEEQVDKVVTNGKPENGEADKKEDEEEAKKDEPKTVSDSEFFSLLSAEELEWYDEHGPKPEDIEDKVLHCTCCQKQVTNQDANQSAQRHPLLGVLICKPCKQFYSDGEWTKDEEGSFEYCRWCGNGGDLILCDKCPESYCKRCVQRNFGRKFLSSMSDSSEWACFICDPKLLYKFRAEYKAVSDMLRAKKITKGKKVATPKKGVSTPGKKDFLKDPTNYVDKSLGDCFRAFSLQTKILEDEQRRWIRNKRNMEVDSAVSMTKNLRKLFAATKRNMEVLDEMILEAFHDKFPEEEFSKVRIAPVTTQSNIIPSELKRKLTIKKVTTPVKKPVAPKKKTPLPKKKRPASSADDVIVLNGEAVTNEIDDSFDPSSMLAVELSEDGVDPVPVKKPKMGPKSASKPGPKSASKPKMGPKSKTAAKPTLKPLSKPGEYKVSTNMFAKKKKKDPKPPSSDPESDIECIDL